MADEVDIGADIADESEEVDDKLALAVFSYNEVLDATKHQDDKIGRMITGIAFLTAAALSLAALGGAEFVTRSFYVGPFHLPLGLITLIVFLVGVIFTVLLLLGSLATPLRIPGLGQEDEAQRKRRRQQKWVRDVRVSQSYFYPISGVSVDRWVDKWRGSVEDLKEERLEQLIREIHNLAVRTTFKYNRGTEAVSALSFSLLTLGLAAIFVSISAATAGDDAIVLNPLQRVIIGLLLGGYSAMQLLIRVKYDSQEVKSNPQQWTLVRNPRTFANVFGLFVVTSVLFDRSWPATGWWFAAAGLLGVAAVASYFLAAPTITRSHVTTQLRSNQLTIPIALVLATGGVLTFAAQGWYSFQLLTAVLLVFSLNAVQIIAADRRTTDVPTEDQPSAAPTGSPPAGADRQHGS